MNHDEMFIRFRDERDNPGQRDRLRQRIAEQTAEFLRNGGAIELVEPGDGKNEPVPVTRLRLWELNG